MAIRAKLSQIFKKTWRRSYTYKLTKEGRTLKGTPVSKLTKFTGGIKLYKDAPYIDVVAKSSAIWTDGSMEQLRKSLLKKCKSINLAGFYFKIKSIPHELIRHHKMATTGKVDRISQGMRNAYGIVIARYARIKPELSVINLHLKEKEKDFEKAKAMLEHFKHHLPFSFKVIK